MTVSAHFFRAKIPMKLNTPDDLHSKRLDILDPVLIMYLPQYFFDFPRHFFVC